MMNKLYWLRTTTIPGMMLILTLLLSGQSMNASAAQTGSKAQVLAPLGTGWTMVFNDEFEGSALDASKWNTCFHWATENNFNYCHAGNDELQWYQPDDVSVQDGQLHLKAEKRQLLGLNYTSGMVASNNKFSYLYGYAEARVRVPKGKGLWPAFWTLPKDNTWPPEIDIMEILGDRPTVAYTSLHWGAENNSTTKVFNGPDFSTDFHTFAADWEPGLIVWSIDGVEVLRLTTNVPDKEMYLILNLAVGGAWPGSPDANTVFPATFDVDYVRVWQKQNSAPTATLTASITQPTFTLTATALPPSETPVPPTATLTSIPPSNTPLPLPATSTPTPSGPTLTVEVNPASAAIGATVSATLKLSTMSNFYGLQTKCTADPHVLSGVGHTEGDIFTSDNSFIVDQGDQSNGTWSIAGSLLNPAPAFNGSGTAFTLNYKVINTGVTSVTCSVLAVDANGNTLPVGVVNGSFEGV